MALCDLLGLLNAQGDDEEEAGVSSSQVLPWVLFFSLVGSLGGVYIIRRGKPQRNRLVL